MPISASRRSRESSATTRGRPRVIRPVDLDDQPRVGPERVHLRAGDVDVRDRLRQPGLDDEVEERALQPALDPGAPGQPQRDRLLEPRQTTAPVGARHRRHASSEIENHRRNAPSWITFVSSSRDQHVCQVDEGPLEGGDAECHGATVTSRGSSPRGLVDVHPVEVAPVARHGDVDERRRPTDGFVAPCPGETAEDRADAGGQSAARYRASWESGPEWRRRVDAGVHAMKGARGRRVWTARCGLSPRSAARNRGALALSP